MSDSGASRPVTPTTNESASNQSKSAVPPPNPKPKTKGTKKKQPSDAATGSSKTATTTTAQTTSGNPTAPPPPPPSTPPPPPTNPIPPPPPPFSTITKSTTTTKKMATVGFLKPFDSTTGDFEDWETTFNSFLKANELDKTKHTERCHGIFLSSIGIQSCALMKNLVAPTSLEKSSLSDLLTAMRDHYKPSPKALAERYKFMRRHRNKGETAAQYLAALRTLARHCKFTSDLEDRLRDQFILGLEHDRAQQSIFTRDDDIKLEEVLKLVMAMEAAETSTSIIRGDSSQQQDHQQIHKTGKFRSQSNNKYSNKSNNNHNSNSGQQQKNFKPANKQQHNKDNNNSASDKAKKFNCKRCGSDKHKTFECKHTDVICYKCSKTGHFANVCLSSGKKTNSVINITRVQQARKNVNSTKDIIYVTVKISGVQHKMELDTGCETSLLSEQLWQKLKKPELVDSPHVFRAYNGGTFKAIGDLPSTIEYNGRKIQHHLPVVKGSSLFGRDLIGLLNFDWSTLSNKRVNSVRDSSVSALIEEYADIFSTPTAADRFRHYKASIILKDDATPRFLKARPLPFATRAKVDQELELMEQTGVITKVETSDWASPLVVVPKANGKVRITGDFKSTVNNQLNITQYPLAVPEDIFATLHDCKVFTKLDGSNAYHQLELDEASKQFLVINTHRGLYRYNVLPQGIASSPAIFQRVMDEILKGFPQANAYIDDTLAADTSVQQHMKTLRAVFEQMRKFNLKLSKEKCEIMQPSLTFLGHRISAENISTTTEKVEAINSIKPPTDVSELSSFMGLINFYNKFLPELSDTAEPLYNLKRQDVEWKWTKKYQTAFEEVKRKITTSPTLAHFDPALPIGVSCDSSSVGAGVVLFHKYPDGSERPIAFASRTLTDTEKRYSQIEKEGLSIIFGINKYYKYLCGRRFLLVTDHRPLLKIFGPKTNLPVYVASRLHHWSVFLQQFQYDVIYRKSADHGNADALSRCSLEKATALDSALERTVKRVSDDLCEALPVTSQKIRYFSARDKILAEVIRYQQQGWPNHLKEEDKHLQQFFVRREEMTVVNNVLLWGYRVIIPSQLRFEILRELHSMHTGIVKMKSLARLHVWWPGLDGEIESMCKSCTTCQQKIADPPSSPLHPWQFPEKPWERLHLDLTGPFLNQMWIVLVDAHSKWPEVFPVHGTTSQVVIQKLDETFARFGLPAQLVTDNGRQFTSDEFTKYLKSHNIKHVLSSVYHPRSNGEAERFVRTFKEAMKPTDLPISRRLAEFLRKYRSTPHSTTGVPPSQLLLGHTIRTRLDLVHPDVKANVNSSQTRQLASHNKRAKARELQPGQAVWVKTFAKNEEKWSYGRILHSLGPVTFMVDVSGRQLKRHADQIRSARQQQQKPDDDNDTTTSEEAPEAAAASNARRGLGLAENTEDD